MKDEVLAVVGALLLAALVIGAAVGIAEYQQHQPCSYFANQPVKDVPLRCLH